MLTPEQVTADDVLIEAIDLQHTTYETDVQGVITHWVVIAQRQWIDDEGDFNSQVYMTHAEETSIAEGLGLCEFAATHYRAMATGR